MSKFKSSATKEAEERIKKNKSKETETTTMKTIKNFAKTVLPWLVLLALASGYVGFTFGHDKGVADQKNTAKQVQAEVAHQVAQLKK